MGPPKNVSPQILFFCDLKPHANFQNPSGRKVTQGENWTLSSVTAHASRSNQYWPRIKQVPDK